MIPLRWTAVGLVLVLGSAAAQADGPAHRNVQLDTTCLQMGSPDPLAPEQLQTVRRLAADEPQVARTVVVGAAGRLQWNLPMRSNDVVLVTLEPTAK